MKTATASAEHEPLLLRVEEAAKRLSMSRTSIYEQMRATDDKGRPRLRSVKEGRSRLIPIAALREYVTLLEKEAEAEYGQAA
ncbi:helix-turn-helix domain-containing protein [Amycolatopsis sp. NPDC051128]|uniref:helix-turn-helix domain-containing protein n=1 Tax=Amycolatopsis sp. NPDC051128 TaxID=3155412 RepID=UPI0034360195